MTRGLGLDAVFSATVSALFVALICSSPVMAAGNWRGLANYALEIKRQNGVIALPWIDRLRFRIAPTAIHRSDGGKIMDRPGVVRSAYKRSNAHDISNFYKMKNPRLNIVMHYAGRVPGEIFSLGVDTGYEAKKITVRPALFLGYARAVKVAKRTHIVLGLSGWVGGKVSEKACLDDHDRQYYCPTLTAWRDHKPIEYRSDIHSSLVLRYDF